MSRILELFDKITSSKMFRTTFLDFRSNLGKESGKFGRLILMTAKKRDKFKGPSLPQGQKLK